MQDFVAERPDRPIEPMLLSYIPSPATPSIILARIRPGTSTHNSGVREVLQRIWQDRTPGEVIHVENVVGQATNDYRARSTLLALIALLCVPLAITGIAGALVYATSQRRREIAIRLSLGARASDIQRSSACETLVLVTVSLAIGLSLGAVLARLASAYLFGVTSIDPAAIAVSGIVIAAVSLASALVPTLRAANVDPAVILREG